LKIGDLNKRIKEFNPKMNFYMYFIDKNNVEEEGIYITFISKVSGKELENLKMIISDFFENKTFYFYYNHLFFHPSIKFGGENNFVLFEKLFVKFQIEIFKNLDFHELLIPIISTIITNFSISEYTIKSFYFYKTLNSKHNLSYEEILKLKNLKEIEYDYKIKELFKNLNTENTKYTEKNFFSKKEIEKLYLIPEYFIMHFTDRLLSLLFLKDEDKQFFVYLSLNYTSQKKYV
jgi:hypothetical protein